MYPGIADRMQKEITALAPSTMKIKVCMAQSFVDYMSRHLQSPQRSSETFNTLQSEWFLTYFESHLNYLVNKHQLVAQVLGEPSLMSLFRLISAKFPNVAKEQHEPRSINFPLSLCVSFFSSSIMMDMGERKCWLCLWFTSLKETQTSQSLFCCFKPHVLCFTNVLSAIPKGVLHWSLIFSNSPGLSFCDSRAIISPFLICAQEYIIAIEVTEKVESGRESEGIDLYNKF